MPCDAEGEMPADQTGGGAFDGCPPSTAQVKRSIPGDFGESVETEWNEYGDGLMRGGKD